MQKVGFPAMKSLDQMRPLSGSAKNFSFSSRQSQDPVSSSGNFSNLKLTAEKLVKEQASMKSDLELANTKLKKSMDHILALEEKLQNAFNENAKLRVMQKEDEKLWRGMESKLSSTKTLCDQLTETLQHLASQVQEAEKDKEFFESKFSSSSEAIDKLKQQMQDLCSKLGAAEETIKIREKDIEELKLEKEQRENSYLDEQCRTASLFKEKAIEALLENLRASENRTEELSLKLSSLEMESKENYKKLQADAQKKAEEMETLQLENESNQLRVDPLLKEMNQLQSVIEEKELLIQQCKENEKKLDQTGSC